MIDQKWVHDWARFRAVDKDGDVSEFENKPYVSGFCWDTDSGDAQSLRFDGDSSNWKDSLQERVTEPEAYKHVFENDDCDFFVVGKKGIGLESTQKPKLMCMDGQYYWAVDGVAATVKEHDYTGCWKDSLQKRIESHKTTDAKSESLFDKLSKAGGKMGEDLRGVDMKDQENDTPAPAYMPKVGEECEWVFGCSDDYGKVTFIGMHDDDHVLYIHSDISYLRVGNPAGFRPIKTQKQRVIEKALHTGNFFKEDAIGLNKLYDAGMLIEGGE
jgi:hypothetical protein